MKPFQLLKLPLVPRDIILQLLESMDLFELSLCSVKLTKLVRSLRWEAEHSLTLTTGQCMICVKMKNGKRNIWWDFKSFFAPHELTQQRIIAGVHFTNCGRLPNMLGVDEYYCNHGDIEEGVIAVTKHFTHIFQGPLTLEINVGVVKKLGKLFSQSQFRLLKKLTLHSSSPIGRIALENIFSNVTVEKELIMNPSTDENYPILQALSVDTLYLECGMWMRREHLLQLKCRIAEIRDNTLTNEDISAFANHWKSGNDTRLIQARFGWDEDKEPFQLIGVEWNRWRASQREKSFILENDHTRVRLNCSRGYDLEREDGLLATVVHDHDPLTPAVHFLVWHERFPERKRIEGIPTQLAPLYRQLEGVNKQYPDASSLERMLSNPQLKIEEFLQTYEILKNLDSEYRPVSVGRSTRRVVFDRMYSLIDLDSRSD